MFCNKCGRQIPDDAIFCSWCGEAIVRMQDNANYTETAPEEPAEPTAAPEAPAQPEAPTYTSAPELDPDISEEQEFLDMTHRLLRWERKAWSITGKVFTIMGIVFAAIFSLVAVAGIGAGDAEGGMFFGIGVLYALLFGGMFLGLGIVSSKAANKIPKYLDSMYYDFEKTEKRSGSIGMLVFTVLFNEIAFIFFIINFVRLKTGGRVIEKIKARQNKQ